MVAETKAKKSTTGNTKETGIEKLTKRILERAEEEAKRVIGEGEKERAEILKKANEKAEAIEKVIFDEGKTKADVEKRKVLADGTIKGRKLKLGIREEAINDVIDGGEERLNKLAETKKYDGILEDTIVQSCYEAGSGEMEIVLRAKDKKLVEKMLSGITERVKKEHGMEVKLKISGDSIESPGAVVRAKGGMIEIDNTFKTRLERMRPSLRTSIAKMLFSG